MSTETTIDFASFNDDVFACARGSYQHDLLTGWQKWSGASLKGTASKWGAVYAQSRKALLGRLNAKAPGGGVWSVPLLVNQNKRLERRLVVTLGGRRYDWLTEREV